MNTEVIEFEHVEAPYVESSIDRDVKVAPQPASNVIEVRRDRMIRTLDTGDILVKSIKTNAIKTVHVDNRVILRNPISVNAYRVQGGKIVPKQQIKNSDREFVNINSNSGLVMTKR